MPCPTINCFCVQDPRVAGAALKVGICSGDAACAGAGVAGAMLASAQNSVFAQRPDLQGLHCRYASAEEAAYLPHGQLHV